jgi:CelD/BcsL family acetyltransferase involved in cellulose biosynthesis
MTSAALRVATIESTSVAELTVECLTRPTELMALRGTWEELSKRARVAHPFVGHTWLLSWWEAFGAGKEQRTLVVRRGDTCVAIAPLMLSRERMYGVPVRVLASPCNDDTPRFEVIVDPEVPEAWEAIWSWIAGARGDWDLLRFTHLPEDSATAARLEELAARDGLYTGFWSSSRSPRYEVRGTWDAFFAGLSPKVRQNARRQMRRLTARGEVRFEELGPDDDLGAALAEGLRLEAAGWKGEGDTAIACRREPSCFYNLLGERSQRRGGLAMHFLTVGGQRVAFSYGLRHGSGLFLMKLGFEPAWASYSPSIILLQHIYERAFQQQVGVIDMLGDSDGWKAHWAPDALAHRWLFAFPNTWLGRLLWTAKFGAGVRVKAVASRAVTVLRERREALVARLRPRVVPRPAVAESSPPEQPPEAPAGKEAA